MPAQGKLSESMYQMHTSGLWAAAWKGMLHSNECQQVGFGLGQARLGVYVFRAVGCRASPLLEAPPADAAPRACPCSSNANTFWHSF